MPLSNTNFRIKVECNAMWQESLIQLHPLQRLYGLEIWGCITCPGFSCWHVSTGISNSLPFLTGKIWQVYINFLALQWGGVTGSLCRFYFLVFLEVVAMLTVFFSWMAKCSFKSTLASCLPTFGYQCPEKAEGRRTTTKEHCTLWPPKAAEWVSFLSFFFECSLNVCMCQLCWGGISGFKLTLL